MWLGAGANSFLITEYQYLTVFMIGFSVIIFVFLASVDGFSLTWTPCASDASKLCAPSVFNGIFATIAFILGAVTSIVSGFLGMKIATCKIALKNYLFTDTLASPSCCLKNCFVPFVTIMRLMLNVQSFLCKILRRHEVILINILAYNITDANARTTLEARKGIAPAFVVAFRSGAVMGFLLAANGLAVLFFTIIFFKLYYGDDWESLFEVIAGYGLGGSSVALFGRVGGGIYTKAAGVKCVSFGVQCFAGGGF